jgi:two-component system, NtrC family, nitrogen regulation response regulator NtrX
MRILVVDDDENIVSSLKWLLEREEHQVTTGQNGSQAVQCCKENLFDAAFLDVVMPGMGGLEALQQILVEQPEIKIFMISGNADISIAVKATKLGAYDFLEKPLNPERVLVELEKLNKHHQAINRVKDLRKWIELEFQMIGASLAMQQLREMIDKAAPTDGRILIRGENGTGKELVAREIHRKSLRANQAFVQLNCAALPKDLIESELFGYEKGAFTGAHKRKPGLIEQAEGGTLLLDEVGDMALETQAKLLRVLQENQFTRLGGVKPHEFDVRILAATNKNLEVEIENQRFRPDLFYRLNVIPIYVPSLNERIQDIPKLAEHFLALYCKKNGKRKPLLSEEAMLTLKNCIWRGNVRELKNIMERLAIMTSVDIIRQKDVNNVLGKNVSSNKEIQSQSLKDHIQHFERDLLQKAFDQYDGNVTHIAEALKTDRANLYRKLQRYGIKNKIEA